MPWLLFLLLLILHGDACVPSVPPPRPSLHFRLPALHAELDPVDGGRIHDAHGREVLLRGVNFNSFVEYWQYRPDFFTTHPFTPEDADEMAGIGWNVVRMLFSWSRVEPEPGVYDEAYLDRLEEAIAILESRGIYTLLDAHQDAWSATLVAAEDEDCPENSPPAFGWDGAPGWATFDGGQPRCALGDIRELSPAVGTAFAAFWADAPGPGDVGIQTRYARMWGHVAERFSTNDAVIGYDVMNEPNAFVFVGPAIDLTRMYERVFAEVRAGEERAGAPRRLFFFEPSILWNDFLVGAPLPFGDDQMVYSPHLYQGGINDLPLNSSYFEQARAEAATFGGVPVVTGEWGSDPARAADPEDTYFDTHHALQDEFHMGSMLWSWHTACGDPHVAAQLRKLDIEVGMPFGLFDDDCATNEPRGMREHMVDAMRRPLVRAAPGRLADVVWDRPSRSVTVRGEGAEFGDSFIVFYPLRHGERLRVVGEGLFGIHRLPAIGGGRFIAGWAEGGDWELVVELD